MSDDLRTALKAMTWEEAKGKLRALVALQGSYPSGNPETASRWADFDEAVKRFIEEIEACGLAE